MRQITCRIRMKEGDGCIRYIFTARKGRRVTATEISQNSQKRNQNKDDDVDGNWGVMAEREINTCELVFFFYRKVLLLKTPVSCRVCCTRERASEVVRTVEIPDKTQP